MWRKVAKVGAVKTDRNRSRRGRKVGVSCMCGLLVARGPGRGATSRIIPRREEVAIPHAYPATGQSAKLELRELGALPGTRAEDDPALARPGRPAPRPDRGSTLYGSMRVAHRVEQAIGLRPRHFHTGRVPGGCPDLQEAPAFSAYRRQDVREGRLRLRIPGR